MNEPRLNVLQVISDQHLATAVGYEDHPQAITPHMDRLAAEGVNFRHAYTANPICTPTRVSILAGQYCHNHGYYGLSGPRPQHLPHFLGHFREHGYRTAAIGKLHLPNEPHEWLDGGCDLIIDNMRGASGGWMHQQELAAAGFAGETDHEGVPEWPGRQQHDARPSKLPFDLSAEGFAVRHAKAFIDEATQQGEPWCMQVSLHRPHQCYTPAQQFWDMYDDDLDLPPTWDADPSHRPPHFRRQQQSTKQMKGCAQPDDPVSRARRVWKGYLACITHCDHALGLLLDHLEQTGQADRTIVVYHSDHGAYSGTHGIVEKAPGICSEAVCRVPMLWRAPGVTSAGHVSRQFAHNIDLADTFCALAGVAAMTSTDGVDLSPLLRGEDRPLREVAVTEHALSKSLRWKQWRFVHYQREMFGGEDVGELYDIDADPDERNNLYHSPDHQDVVHECRRRVLEWLIETTRITTALPARPGEQDPSLRRIHPIAGDGKRSNQWRLETHYQTGNLNYL